MGVWTVQGSLALSDHHLLSCPQLADGFLLDWLSHLDLAPSLGALHKGYHLRLTLSPGDRLDYLVKARGHHSDETLKLKAESISR